MLRHSYRALGALLLPFFAIMTLPAADTKEEAGFEPMFNGKDLTGWVNVNCAPSTFFVKDKEIITTGRPTGFLRTTKQYENFIAEFDWMHVNTKQVGNSGFFVWADPLPAVGTGYTRGIEVQVLVNLEKKDAYTSHGDLFSIWGASCKPDRPHPQGWARCLPSERRCKGGGEWNHYRVTAKDGTIKLEVNGKEVSGVSECTPRKGYLALESEGAECHFRNLKIKELPSNNPAAKDIADVAKDFKNLYTGLDLSGWKAPEDDKKQWQAHDWQLHYQSKGARSELKTEIQTADTEVIVDFRFDKKSSSPVKFGLRETEDGYIRFGIDPEGATSLTGLRDNKSTPWMRGPDGIFKGLKPKGEWNRFHAILQGDTLRVFLNGRRWLVADMPRTPTKGAFVLRPVETMDFANLFLRELK
jgi:hypothetical protein